MSKLHNKERTKLFKYFQDACCSEETCCESKGSIYASLHKSNSYYRYQILAHLISRLDVIAQACVCFPVGAETAIKSRNRWYLILYLFAIPMSSGSSQNFKLDISLVKPVIKSYTMITLNHFSSSFLLFLWRHNQSSSVSAIFHRQPWVHEKRGQKSTHPHSAPLCVKKCVFLSITSPHLLKIHHGCTLLAAANSFLTFLE